jgi:hypothetical protein
MNIAVFEAESQSNETSSPQDDTITRPPADPASQRILLIGQLRLLLLRAELGLRIDLRSVLRLAALARRIDGRGDPTTAKPARMERCA